MSAESQPPYWVLISVLFSSQPLTPALAMCLHEAALDLYKSGRGTGQVGGDLITGTVRNMQKDVVMGAISGPAFEAEIETERGSGVVRFLLTRQGLELMQHAAAAEAAGLPGAAGGAGIPGVGKKPKYLN